VKKAVLVFLGVVALGAVVWFLETATEPEPVAIVDNSSGEYSGPPVPVLLATDRAGQKVHLRWRSVPGALAYHLWRAPGSAGKFEVVFMGQDTTFTDGVGLLPDQIYCYQLATLDPEFDESGFSEQKCVDGNPDSR
jgi:hypothetical protein